MIVTKEKPREEFYPVVIRLETQEELNALWHILDCSMRKTLRDYIGEHRCCKEKDIEEMWRELFSELNCKGGEDA